MKHVLKMMALEERIVLDAALAASLVHHSPSESIIYVNANAAPGGNGTSWAHAFNSLQSALNEAAQTSASEQIWIAQGTYTPSQIYEPTNASGVAVQGGASGIRTENMYTFNLPNNVQLYGGFVGNETSLSQANPLAHPTILSGDLLGNNLSDPNASGFAASMADNSWHVITAGDDITDKGVTATLTGLTIIGGYAAGPDAFHHDDGGGLWAVGGSHITLDDDIFLNNIAGVSSSSTGAKAGGGAIFAFGAGTSLTIGKDTQFLTNFTGDSQNPYSIGGAILVENGATVSISDGNFVGNTTTNEGGAIAAINGGQLTVSGTFFLESQASSGGGAIYMQATNGTLSNDQFFNGSAEYGGAVMLQSDTSVTISHSQFSDNIAHEGGAIYLSHSDASIVSDTFSGNSAAIAADIYGLESIINKISTTSAKLVNDLKSSDHFEPFNNSYFHFQ